MRTRVAVVVASLAILAGSTSCGRSPSTSSDATLATTTTAVVFPTQPGDWGSLTEVCGPRRGGGRTPSSDATGVTDGAIRLGTIADAGFAGRPGLHQELLDAGQAFAEWCNAAGGINGRKVLLTRWDARVTEYRSALEAACQGQFALVGGGALDDSAWSEVGPACGLVDFPGLVSDPSHAGRDGHSPTETRTVQAVPDPADRMAVGAARLISERYPDAPTRHGYVRPDHPVSAIREGREIDAFGQLGHTTVHESTYDLAGESDWAPVAEGIAADRVEWLTFVGEPANAAALSQSLAANDAVPAVQLLGPELYDPSFIHAAGVAAESTFVGTPFVPLEEAEFHPATKLYQANVRSIRGKPAALGLQSTSAWLLFARLATRCDRADDLTRSCLLREAATVDSWTAGGLHAPTDPAHNRASDCTVVLQVQAGQFRRWAPTGEDFACDPSFVIPVAAGG